MIPLRVDGGSSTRNPPVLCARLSVTYSIYLEYNPYDSQDDGQWQVLKTLIKWWPIWKMKGFLCHFW